MHVGMVGGMQQQCDTRPMVTFPTAGRWLWTACPRSLPDSKTARSWTRDLFSHNFRKSSALTVAPPGHTIRVTYPTCHHKFSLGPRPTGVVPAWRTFLQKWRPVKQKLQVVVVMKLYSVLFYLLLQHVGFAGLFDVLSSRPVLNKVSYHICQTSLMWYVFHTLRLPHCIYKIILIQFWPA